MASKVPSPYLIPGIKLEKYRPETLCQDVCAFFEITEENIKSKKRDRIYVEPRHTYLSLAHYFFVSEKIPYARLAAVVGGDHSSLIHAMKTVSNLCDTNKTFNKAYNELKQKIKEKIELIESQDKRISGDAA